MNREPEGHEEQQATAGASGQMNPGDQAPPGTPGTGETICSTCGGSGRLDAGVECPNCGGTGRVTEAVSAGP